MGPPSIISSLKCNKALFNSAPSEVLSSAREQAVASGSRAREQAVNNDTPSEVHEQSARILTSRTFAKSPRLRELFTFLVDQSTGERASDAHSLLKEFIIAEAVFGRGAGFDPAVDSVVRCEMRRLRQRLDRYYLTEGSTDPLLITIPKGAHVPYWQRRTVSEFADLSGTVQAHYRLLRRTAVNRAYSIYEAECVNSARNVTICIPSRQTCDDEIRRNRVWADWKVATNIDHPGIERILDLVETTSVPLLVSARTKWPSLRAAAAETTFSLDQIVDITRQLAKCFAAVHAAGILHGGVDPDSISVEIGEGNEIRIRITPAGMASLNYDDQGWTQCNDIWVIGRILQYLQSSSDHTDDKLQAIAARCMNLTGEDRFEAAQAVVEALVACQPGKISEPPPPIPEGFVDRLRGWIGKMRLQTSAYTADSQP